MTKIQFIILCFAISLMGILVLQRCSSNDTINSERIVENSTTEKIVVPISLAGERYIFITTYTTDGIEYKIFHSSEGLVVVNHTKEKLHVDVLIK